MTKDPVSHDRLQELLFYDGESGQLVNRVRRKQSPIGKVVGYVNGPYREIWLDNKRYLEHRLIWFYVHGRWPIEIDHINGDGHDNRISNLRECTHSQNQTNRRKGRSSVLKGAHRFRSRWKSTIFVDKKSIALGTFDTPEEAHKAYVAASKRYHKEFGRTD